MAFLLEIKRTNQNAVDATSHKLSQIKRQKVFSLKNNFLSFKVLFGVVKCVWYPFDRFPSTKMTRESPIPSPPDSLKPTHSLSLLLVSLPTLADLESKTHSELCLFLHEALMLLTDKNKQINALTCIGHELVAANTNLISDYQKLSKGSDLLDATGSLLPSC